MLQKDWGVSEQVKILIYEKNFVLSDNPGQKKINKKKIRQNWTGPENFDISFCVSFDH